MNKEIKDDLDRHALNNMTILANIAGVNPTEACELAIAQIRTAHLFLAATMHKEAYQELVKVLNKAIPLESEKVFEAHDNIQKGMSVEEVINSFGVVR